MKTSAKGIAEILSHEAIVPMPYRDSVGVWTFGVGHTKNAGPPDPLSYPKGVPQDIAEVLRVFKTDLPKYERRVMQAFTRELAQHEFDAAVSFDYNTGGILKASWVGHFNAGNKPAAAKAILFWNKPSSIIGRRTKEMHLLRDGRYSGNGRVMVYPADGNGKVLWSKGKQQEIGNLFHDPDIATPPLFSIALVKDAQQDLKLIAIHLKKPEFDPGNIDGLMGPKTRAALLAWQQSRDDVPDTGTLDSRTDQILDETAAAIVPPDPDVEPVKPPPTMPNGEPIKGAGGMSDLSSWLKG